MDRSSIFLAVLVSLIVFLSVLLYVIVADNSSAVAEKWSYSTNDSISTLRSAYIGEDSTVYLLKGRDIIAIDEDGGQKWKIAVPEMNDSGKGGFPYVMMSTTSLNGCLYTYLYLDNWTPDGSVGELVAISPEGRIMWTKLCDRAFYRSVAVAGDTIYLTTVPATYNGTLTAFNPDGKVKWSKDKIFSDPAFDDAGNVYLIRTNKIPIYSDNLQAYTSDGALLWNSSLSTQGVNGPGGLFFHNGSLYVETYGPVRGLAGIDKNGTVKWKQDFPEMTSVQITFDQDNIIYATDHSNARVISPDGKLLADYGFDLLRSYQDYAGLNNGLLYVSKLDKPAENGSLDDLPGVRLTAFSLKNHTQLWSYDVKPKSVREVTIEPANVDAVIRNACDVDACNRLDSSQLYQYYGLVPGSVTIKNNTYVYVYPGKDRVYVSYWANNYEFPAIYGQSRCACSGSLYAFTRDGKLLWEKPLDSYVDTLVERNGTIYYSTGDGRFSATSMGFTAGLVAASLYLFFRFLLVGTVSRAKTRIDKNENRNRITQFITANPGANLYDICRGLEMNVGTVRYHLLVLTVNHRIKAGRGDTRSERYFACGRQYSPEEKVVISLLKRGPVEKLLGAMITTPGLPNNEISRVIGLPESAVSRYLRELAERGVVVKKRTESGKLSYVIDEKYQGVIIGCMED